MVCGKRVVSGQQVSDSFLLQPVPPSSQSYHIAVKSVLSLFSSPRLKHRFGL